MDIQMGKIIDRLKKENLYDNTYIFFTATMGDLSQDTKELFMKQEQKFHLL